MSEALLSDPAAASPDVPSLAVGLFGKHPAKGDFIECGLSPRLRTGLETWLDTMLSSCRQNLGAAFEPLWDQKPAPQIGFWIGEALAVDVVAGLLQPSRDKVGRRYPLILLAAGPPAHAPDPPVLGDIAVWMTPMASAFAAIALKDSFGTAAELIGDMTWPAVVEKAGGEPYLVARRQDGDFVRLCRDVAASDHRRAAAASSYWWRAGDGEDGAVAIFACQGLPDWRAVAWLLGLDGAKVA